MSSIRVLIVDDHELIRRGINTLLAEHPEYEVIAEASDGETAVELAKESQPDLVLLDIALPKMNGLRVIELVREVSPRTEFLVISQYDSSWMVKAVTSAGARGYILKSDTGLLLLSAMAAVSQHQLFIRSLNSGINPVEKLDRLT